MFRRLIPIALIAFSVVAIFSCSKQATEPGPAEAVKPTPMAATEPPPLIPRDVFFADPDIVQVKLSHDGTYISYLKPVDGILNVWVAPFDKPGEAKPVTNDTVRGVTQYFWAYDNKTILYLRDKDGDENWRLHGVDANGSNMRDYTPGEKVQARIIGTSYLVPDKIVIGINDRDPRYHDLYTLDLASGKRTLLLKNEAGYSEFTLDDNLNVVLVDKLTKDGGNTISKADGKDGFAPFLTVGRDDAMNTGVVALTKDGKSAYLISSIGRKTGAFVTIDFDSGKETVLFEDPRADVTGLILHPTEHTPLAAAVTLAQTKWTALDDSVAADLKILDGLGRGDWGPAAYTLDQKRWIVHLVPDDGPVRYFLYDRDSRKATFLFAHRPALEKLPLARMYPVTIKSRDGLDLVSYYTLPSWLDQNGKTDKPLPMVLSVHGGPWYRDGWGYNPIHQWLSNRGYAVLSVNFRGSTGFGKDFINAGDKEWGGKMHDDLLDAVAWAIDKGLTTKDQVAIFGGSYGGYATLVGITMTPDTFACGVDIVGPSNLTTFANAIPPYWEAYKEIFAQRIGDWRTEDGKAFLLTRSPITYVDQIAKPLLIGQGANDPRVVQSESDQIVQTMQKKDIPVSYVLFPDEGHGFRRPANRFAFFAITELFLKSCLNGRAQELTNDFADSSIQVPAGAELIPGLEKSLPKPEEKPEAQGPAAK